VQVDFYHLAGMPLERVLPRLAEKAAGAGRVLLHARDPALLDQLDRLLWEGERTAFLPHARATGSAADVRQPLLLTDTLDPPANQATLLILADGHWPGLPNGYERVLYLFDESALPEARAAWRSLGDVPHRYWKQDERGRWVEGP
jgi:DNA polymerase III subunit chi